LPDRPALVDAATGIVVSYPSFIASAPGTPPWSSRPRASRSTCSTSRSCPSALSCPPPTRPQPPEEYAHQVALSRPVVMFASPEVAAKLPGHVRCVVFGSDAQESLSSTRAKAAPPP
uniref:Uncharacterized protein n=1 Tax=Triticum urartu TaxID=4572 RepID=A0A8R7PEU8_TRIUA